MCTSGDPRDLKVTDDIAAAVLENIGVNVNVRVKQQYDDNIRWIREAGRHHMVCVWSCTGREGSETSANQSTCFVLL